jgi:hypothetical protein
MPSASVRDDVINPVFEIFTVPGLLLQHLVVKVHNLADILTDRCALVQQFSEEVDRKFVNLAFHFGRRADDKLIDLVTIVLLHTRLELRLPVGVPHENCLMLANCAY